MELRRALASVVACLVCLVDPLKSLNCGAGERQFPSSACLTFSTSSQSNSDAHSSCGNGAGLVTVEDPGQFEALSRYVEVLSMQGAQYWLGYMYNASGVLVGVQSGDVSSMSPVLEPSNYDPNAQHATESAGVCIAVGVTGSSDVYLYRVLCDANILSICSQTYTAPSVTSITSDISRFLSTGTIVLTCSAQNYDGEIVWRQDGIPVSSGTAGLSIESDNGTLSVTFDGISVGYECSVRNPFGGVVSEAVVLDSSGGSLDTAPVITSLSSSPTNVQFGTSVELTCTFTTSNTLSRLEWLFNGAVVQTVTLQTGQNNTVMSIASFSVSNNGVYQCHVFNVNNDNSIQDLSITATAGEPGPVKFPIALADNQRVVFVSWLYPLDYNDLDPLLLRYQVQYRQRDTSPQTKDDISPLNLNKMVSENGAVETTLTDLEPATIYLVTIQAISTARMGEAISDTAFVTTYGFAPSETVDNLKLTRTKDNKTLFAIWNDLKTAPPEGPIVLYRIQYRDSGKEGAVNTAHLAVKYNYFVVTPVDNAQKYQMRVSAGVVNRRDPLEYVYGPYTEWLEVQGITDTVPPVPPTAEGVLPVEGVIAVSVIVPVVVVGLIILIVVVAAVCLIQNKNRSDGHRHDSLSAHLKPTGSPEPEQEKELDPVV